MEIQKAKEASEREKEGYWNSLWRDFKTQVYCCHTVNDAIRESITTGSLRPESARQKYLNNQSISKYDFNITTEAQLLTSYQSLPNDQSIQITAAADDKMQNVNLQSP